MRASNVMSDDSYNPRRGVEQGWRGTRPIALAQACRCGKRDREAAAAATAAASEGPTGAAAYDQPEGRARRRRSADEAPLTTPPPCPSPAPPTPARTPTPPPPPTTPQPPMPPPPRPPTTTNPPPQSLVRKPRGLAGHPRAGAEYQSAQGLQPQRGSAGPTSARSSREGRGEEPHLIALVHLEGHGAPALRGQGPVLAAEPLHVERSRRVSRSARRRAAGGHAERPHCRVRCGRARSERACGRV